MKISLDIKDAKGLIDTVITKYHFGESDREKLKLVYDKMRSCMCPCATYRINQRTTGNRQIDEGQAAIVAMTLGKGIDRLKEEYESEGNLEDAYRLDCIANEVLFSMYAEFNKLYTRFHRRYIVKYHFIGTDISLDKIPEILYMLYGDKADEGEESRDDYRICSNSFGVLTPSKSVIFYALLSDNLETVCEGVCVGCGNEYCENRIQQVTNSLEEKQITNYNSSETEKEGFCLNYGYRRIFGNM